MHSPFYTVRSNYERYKRCVWNGGFCIIRLKQGSSSNEELSLYILELRIDHFFLKLVHKMTFLYLVFDD